MKKFCPDQPDGKGVSARRAEDFGEAQGIKTFMPLPGSNARYNVMGPFLQSSPARAGVDAGSWEHYPSRVARVPFVFP